MLLLLLHVCRPGLLLLLLVLQSLLMLYLRRPGVLLYKLLLLPHMRRLRVLLWRGSTGLHVELLLLLLRLKAGCHVGCYRLLHV